MNRRSPEIARRLYARWRTAALPHARRAWRVHLRRAGFPYHSGTPDPRPGGYRRGRGQHACRDRCRTRCGSGSVPRCGTRHTRRRRDRAEADADRHGVTGGDPCSRVPIRTSVTIRTVPASRASRPPPDGVDLEIITGPPTGPHFTHVIFDHDGTISTLRQGWEEIMEPMMIGRSSASGSPASTAHCRMRFDRSVRAYIDQTTGIQTLVQMKGLVGLVRRFKCVPESAILDEHGYKEMYNQQLLALVEGACAETQARRIERCRPDGQECR